MTFVVPTIWLVTLPHTIELSTCVALVSVARPLGVLKAKVQFSTIEPRLLIYVPPPLNIGVQNIAVALARLPLRMEFLCVDWPLHHKPPPWLKAEAPPPLL